MAKHYFSTFDEDHLGENIEHTMFVIHISNAMQSDYCLRLANEHFSHKPLFPGEVTNWLGDNALGANTIHIEPEKNGDGHIIVLGGI
ncbi:MAG: hypothetical protein ACJAQ6_001981 [Arenicella sp.]